MKNERIVFMGTPNISAQYLSALIKNHYNIIAVYTQPAKRQDRGMDLKNTPVQNLSIVENIPCFTPEILNSQPKKILLLINRLINKNRNQDSAG